MIITKIPQGEKYSEDFEIKLNGEKVQAYTARVSAMPFNTVWPNHQRYMEQTEEASFLTFAMKEDINVELISSRDFSDVVIRPLSDNIKATVDGRKIQFSIIRPGQYTVELDGWHKALHIFASPEVDFGVTPETQNVIYFGPGVHTPGVVEVSDNTIVYIHQDAVVYGGILGIQVKNVKILGYGIIDGSREQRTDYSLIVPKDVSRRNSKNDAFSPVVKGLPVDDVKLPVKATSILTDKDSFKDFLEKFGVPYSCIHLYGCEDCLVQGVVLRDAPGFTVIGANCKDLVIDDIKLIGSWRYNADGIDLFNCCRCTIKNSFLRNFDDCVVIKGIPGWDKSNSEDILVENCVVWCDWGGTLEIGAETVADEFKNITYRDCDCIHNAHVAMRLHNCDRAHVHNILYEDIRVEYSKYDESPVYQESDDMKFVKRPAFIAPVQITFSGENYYSNAKLKGHVSDVHYKDIQVLAEPDVTKFAVIFEGYSKEHDISGVTLENFTLNNKKIDTRSMISTNEFVSKIDVK